MKLVVIESPFAGNIKRHVRYLEICVAFCRDKGVAFFASHGFYPQYLKEDLVEERHLGIRMGYEILRRADEVWFFEDLGFSDGMNKAMVIADFLEKPMLKIKILNNEEREALTENFPDSPRDLALVEKSR